MVRFAVAAVAITLALQACHAAPARPTWPDAPVALRDETDRDQAIDRMWALPAASSARAALRARIASAQVVRIDEALAANDPYAAAELLAELASLWQGEVARFGVDLAFAVPTLARAHDQFAKSAQLAPAVLAIAMLAEADAPAKHAEHVKELDEVLAFADDLAVAEDGPQATRAQPIQLLAPAASALPIPWLVDRYVGLLEQRQRTISAVIAKSGATIEIVRAHPDLLRTARRIAAALARAGRADEIHAHLVAVPGIGADRELSMRSEIVAEQPTPSAYADLAAALRAMDASGGTARHPGDGKDPDRAASLAVCLRGLARFPNDAQLLAAAANDARALGRIDQPIALYETALTSGDDVDGADAFRLGKLFADEIARAAAGGRPAAARAAWTEAHAFLARVDKVHPHPVWSQAAAIAESALGRGLLQLGLVDEGQAALENSIERAPSIDSYEALATLDLERDRLASAQKWAALGLEAVDDTTSGDRYRRAKLERLAGDIARRAAKTLDAREHYAAAVGLFASLGEDKEIPRSIAAERALERGRARWWMAVTAGTGTDDGHGVARSPTDGPSPIDDVIHAVELDPDTPAIVTTAVDFLLQIGRYAEAADAFHTALTAGTTEIHKTYMSLWLVGDARRRGATADRLAQDYLAARTGDVWYELLARAASGRLDARALAAAATTGPRRAELAFYTATLGLAPGSDPRALLRQVVAARVVLGSEYRLARVYLGNGG